MGWAWFWLPDRDGLCDSRLPVCYGRRRPKARGARRSLGQERDGDHRKSRMPNQASLLATMRNVEKPPGRGSLTVESDSALHVDLGP